VIKIGFSQSDRAKRHQTHVERMSRLEDPANVHWPGILRQTSWQVGFFSFGKAEAPDKLAYFNPGLVERPDGLWLVARRSENRPGITIGMNSLMAFKLDGFLAPQYGVPVKMIPRFPGEHFEDARAVQRGDTTWISCSNFIVFPRKPKELWTGSQIAVCPVNQQWQAFDRIDPVYGSNAKTARNGNDIEKNWIWFWPGAENEPHLIYSTDNGEHRVVKFSDRFQVQDEWRTRCEAEWRWGIIRGGTPPVRFGNEYWTFFHSSLPLATKYHRRYFMGAYSFLAEPPWNVTQVTGRPLLAASDEDEWWPQKPLVVFPCGAVLQGNTWLVTMGVNDLKCAWMKIPHVDLCSKMRPLSAGRVKPSAI
jgi:predicted GH43/DUF377 family glycosyl hydrolase